MARRTPLWRCPKCDRPFVNVNQPHSCGKHTVEAFLVGKGERARQLFEGFRELVTSCGEVTLAPAKTRVGFQNRMIFAAVNALSNARLRAHVVLARRVEHERFTKIESLGPKGHVHHFVIRSPDELDDTVRAWVEEAYRVGCQEHLD